MCTLIDGITSSASIYATTDFLPLLISLLERSVKVEGATRNLNFQFYTLGHSICSNLQTEQYTKSNKTQSIKDSDTNPNLICSSLREELLHLQAPLILRSQQASQPARQFLLYIYIDTLYEERKYQFDAYYTQTRVTE